MSFQVTHLRLLIALLTLLLAPAAGAAESGNPVSPAARAAWSFDRTDLPPHPAVRFGVLPNGMRYALMRSAVPAGGMAVRLRIDVGARMEGARERGFAHLAEHLIFHGTPAIPEGSLPLMLAHRGMRHWSDFNAFTSYDETVYRLDMTRADAAAREAALLVMREVAGNLLFTGPVVRAAKRSVQSEIRARDPAVDGITSAQNAFFAPGTPIARGTVPGTVSDVGRAEGEALRRFYLRFYRPERAVLVMVGDFDPDAAEREIAARFAEWRGLGAPGADPVAPLLPTRTGVEARIFVHPAAPTSVTIAAVRPLGGAGDVGGRRDAHFLEHLGSQMLNRRLSRLAAAGVDAPFARADMAVYEHFGTVRLARIELEARGGEWKRALEAGASELARVRAEGFSQAELDQQIAASRRALVRDAAPRTSTALADAIIDAVNRRIVFTQPADPAGTDAYLAQVRLADVNAAFRALWNDQTRLLFVSHGRSIPNGEAAVLAAWHSPDLR